MVRPSGLSASGGAGGPRSSPSCPSSWTCHGRSRQISEWSLVGSDARSDRASVIRLTARAAMLPFRRPKGNRLHRKRKGLLLPEPTARPSAVSALVPARPAPSDPAASGRRLCRGHRSGRCRSSGTTSTSPTCAIGTDGADDPRRDRPDRLRGHAARPRVPGGCRAARRPRRAAPRAWPRSTSPLPATVDGPRPTPLADRPRAAAAAPRRRRRGPRHRPRRLAGSRPRAAARADEPGTPVLTDAGWDALVERASTRSPTATREAGHRARVPPARGDVHRDAGRGRTPRRPPRSRADRDLPRRRPLPGRRRRPRRGALRDLGDRVTHVHLKDVDPTVLGGLRAGDDRRASARRSGRACSPSSAPGCSTSTASSPPSSERDYDGWLMVEQDSSWAPPSESAAIGRRVLDRGPATGGLGAGRRERARR